MQNHEFIAKKNSEMRDAGRDLRLEVNEYTDQHFDEFIKMKGG